MNQNQQYNNANYGQQGNQQIEMEQINMQFQDQSYQQGQQNQSQHNKYIDNNFNNNNSQQQFGINSNIQNSQNQQMFGQQNKNTNTVKFEQNLIQSQFKKNKKGGLYINPLLKEGPIIQRRCTDLFCCYIFIFMILGMITFSVLGFVYGHPDRLTVPFDPDGRACGKDKGVEDAPYVYAAVPYSNFFHRNVCVKKCPTWGREETPLTTLDCVTNKEVTTCEQTFSDTCDFPSQCTGSNQLEQSVFIYNTTSYFGRICLSNSKSIIENTDLSKVFDITRLQEYYSDLHVARWALTVSAFFSFFLGFIFLILLMFIPSIITWIGILIYLIMLILLGVFFMTKAQDFVSLYQSTQDPTAYNTLEIDSIFMRALSYTMFVTLVLSIVGLICMFKQIRLAIAIIKSAQQYISDTLEILVVPTLISILKIGAWAFWMVIFLFIFSAGEIQGGRRDGPFKTIIWDTDFRYMLWFWLIGGLWIHCTFLTVNQFIITSSTSIWYFSQPLYKARRPVLQSLYRCFRYHMGSIVLGSAILPFVQVFRLLFSYVDKQAKLSYGPSKQPQGIMKFVTKCCACCLGCFECGLKYLNKATYIFQGLTGKTFYQSAKYSYQIINQNTGKYGTTIGIGQVFILIGKLLISTTTTFLCYMVLSYYDYYEQNMFSPLFPCLFCLVYSYMIGNLFLSIFGISIDTILQCACLDEELYQEDGIGAQHTPQPLIEFFNDIGLLDQFKSKSSIQRESVITDQMGSRQESVVADDEDDNDEDDDNNNQNPQNNQQNNKF